MSERGREKARKGENEGVRERERGGVRGNTREGNSILSLPGKTLSRARCLRPTPNSQPSSTSHLLLLLCVALAVPILSVCFSFSFFLSLSVSFAILSRSSRDFRVSPNSLAQVLLADMTTRVFDYQRRVCLVLSVTTSAEGIARYGTSVGRSNEFECVSLDWLFFP